VYVLRKRGIYTHNGDLIMRTKEIETELILQEMESIRCKVEELNVLIRSYAKAMLSHEHGITLRMEREGVHHED
jgi:hypothetical protein